MPSNKTISIVIVCFSVVFSIWMISKGNSKESVSIVKNTNTSVSSVKTNSENSLTNEDWKKLLTTVDKKNENVVDLTQKSGTGSFDDTTITAQLSRELLSKYLSLKQGGKTLSSEEMAQIVGTISESKNYTEIKGPVYIKSNLIIAPKNDLATDNRYEENIRTIFKVRGDQVTDDPMLFVNQLVGPNADKYLKKINSEISAGKAFIEDMMKIEVPSKAISVHLEVLNATSNLISDVEAMREIGNDPVISLAGISQYGKDIVIFQNAVKKMSSYLSQN